MVRTGIISGRSCNGGHRPPYLTWIIQESLFKDRQGTVLTVPEKALRMLSLPAPSAARPDEPHWVREKDNLVSTFQRHG